MARRKKVPEGFHRKQIAAAAQELFHQNGISHTTMDEIAKAAGYSKATLYVYFQNKEEIVGTLVYKSMELLYKHICNNINTSNTTAQKYNQICWELVKYQRQFPYYFDIVLGKINIDFSKPYALPADKDTFDLGEKINEQISIFVQEGKRNFELKENLEILSTLFVFWGAVSGIIKMAANKKDYIEITLGKSQDEFLSFGFDLLYHAIANDSAAYKN